MPDVWLGAILGKAPSGQILGLRRHNRLAQFGRVVLCYTPFEHCHVGGNGDPACLRAGRRRDSNGETMLRTTPAAPVGTAAKVPPQAGVPAAPAGGRHRHQDRRGYGRVKTGVVVALSCGLLAAGTMFAVHLGLAAGRLNGPADSAGSAGTASRAGALRTLQVLSVSP